MKHRIYAHRGVSGLAPENTLAAIKLCKEYNITWFECDIDVIADGTVILTHDSTLDRCTNRSGSYYDLTQADLAGIDAGSWFGEDFQGEPLPTLPQVVQWMNTYQLNANIEIKSCEAGRAMALKLLDGLQQALTALEPEREVIISSFNPLLLAELKKRCPQLAVACLYESYDCLDDALTVLEWVGAEYIHLSQDGLTRETVARFNNAGYKVAVYTVNSTMRANELFNWGVFGVFSDVPHLLAAQSRKMNTN
ncbi:glycerophosphoryl diester phosphodiesterase [Testudinibacter sp. TR-2022]|uniref:glycerophosphodiester phosphodiesterase family protein n=1 Tax=Testudinibacter sp. TR-2022 TaxID=2585029 RepID=UPI00111B4579|nr:glycerophosphodiester phosphodiesterase family protein [Testudinibacter sp. TR-2022]TNH02412.1 glycerophosphoryl diester phosphodiesterase [Pasteurellaceae bacterium Phil31]TNH10241.1 glycerophosphoryl diester phosphodiesterase [Testudinibacter sp. TR-2022]TNH12124.1 glycerophosphoryl diester phosphodiesterase [Testudinibacter sp. TR-2022]TNH12770.1 glycerophosphoryl diester phosphodiesterase [Testudinibacter sp. TR-2022]TNH13822.1 glycerophosphoryl diester phosphodiesterase [Testudinibacte